ncbi:MAG: phosphatidate cytidylyltransferase [Pseudobdellovibrionaceae bacterium]|nr:MAG: phosphatidate cytidylyltransferase [Pseudobdellovibrionaceae bacterium]
MSGLKTRIISAFAALILILASYFYAGRLGLTVLAGMIVLVGIYEYSQIALAPLKLPRGYNVWFVLLCASATASVVVAKHSSFLILGFAASLYLSGAMWIDRKGVENISVWRFLTIGLFGLVYFGTFAAAAVKILATPQGERWFALLLGIVFAGDIAAYFGGKAFGKTKLMPEVSPGKTLAGSVSGVAGSIVASVLLAQMVLPHLAIWFLVVMAAVAAFFGQSGDLLISLIKRIANVKDSGKIMPGHGGVLDRLDGVILAAPTIYAAMVYSDLLLNMI